jgi:AsmA protein
MLKKILIGLGALVALLVLAIAALFLFVDVNAFKPRIEQAASSQLGRTLRIDGDLKLAIFPRIAIALPRTTLSERGSEKTFAQIENARIAVAVLPLLKGRIEADRIQITGLVATLEQRKDGSSNIDDLTGAEKGEAPKHPGSESAAGARPPFDIGGIELVNAQLNLRGPEGPLLQLSKLHLTTGRLAPRTHTQVSLATDFSAPPNKAQGSAKIDAEVEIDLPGHKYGVRGLSASGSGKLAAESFDVSLSAPQLAFGEITHGDKLQLKAKLAGTQAVDVTLDLNGFSGSAQEVAVQALQLSADLQQAERKIVARLKGTAQFAVQPQKLQLPRLAGEVVIDDPSLPQKAVRLPLDGSLTLDAKKQTVGVRLDTKFDDTVLKATVDVAGFAQPRVRVDVDADKLDVDRYLPPPQAAGATPASEPAAEQKIDLSALRGLNLNGNARIGQLQAKGIKAASVRVGIKAAGGRLDVAPLAAKLYGGSLDGAAFAAADGNRIGLNANLAGVAIGPLLRDALDQDLLEGSGNVQLAVTTAGATGAAMKRALDGKAALQLRDGAIKGINIAQKFREAKAMLSGGGSQAQRADMTQQTDFSELSASFAIKDGVATSNDLDAKSPLLRLGGAGRVDIGGGSIDYTALVSVVGSLRGQDGRDISELRGVTIPVRLSGPFEKLTYNIDWAGVAKEALKAKATEELKKKVTPKIEEQRKKIEDRAKDALKGLFSR